MSDPSWQSYVATTCQGLAEVTRGVFSWEWDDRFGAALTVIVAADGDRAYRVFEKALPTVWDSASLAAAPTDISRLVSSLGGLRAGQKLFVSGGEVEAKVIAIWWPWGGNQKISVRVAAAPTGGASSDAFDVVVRKAFGL